MCYWRVLLKKWKQHAADHWYVSKTVMDPKLSPGERHIWPGVLYFQVKCVKTRVFLDEYKVAKVNPLHKDGNVNEYGNYRPISLLPSLAKVFERIIYNRIINYFEHFELLNANQFRFRSKLNTVDAALRFVEEIRNMENLKKRSSDAFTWSAESIW